MREREREQRNTIVATKIALPTREGLYNKDRNLATNATPLSQQSHIGYEIIDRIVYNNSHETTKVIVASFFGGGILTNYKLF